MLKSCTTWTLPALICALVACTPAQVESVGLAQLSIRAGLAGISRNANIAYGPLERQRLDVFVPQDQRQQRPVVLFTYGGGFKQGSKDEYGFVAEAFSSLGFVTVIFDYRLHPSVTWPAYMHDGAQAVAWVKANIARFGGDPNRVLLAGHSAGAYLVSMLALNPAYLQAVQLEPSSIQGVLAFSAPFAFWDPKQAAHGGFIGADIQAVMGSPATYPQTQPIAFVTRDAPPFVIVHGSEDGLLEVAQARAMKNKLEQASVRVAYLEYKLDHASTILAMAKPLRFLASTYTDVHSTLERFGWLPR